MYIKKKKDCYLFCSLIPKIPHDGMSIESTVWQRDEKRCLPGTSLRRTSAWRILCKCHRNFSREKTSLYFATIDSARRFSHSFCDDNSIRKSRLRASAHVRLISVRSERSDEGRRRVLFTTLSIDVARPAQQSRRHLSK